MIRRESNQIIVGDVKVGGGARVTVQSMLSKHWSDTKGNIIEATELEAAGCDILRVAIPTAESVALIGKLKEKISIPLVADIHFDYKLALASVEAGIDKIRINPGNIGSDDKVKLVADACGAKNIPIRIGVNSGSIEKEILKKYGSPTPPAMVESAVYHASLLEKFGFTQIAVSMKSNNVPDMMEAYKLMAREHSYPLHLGVTHTGTAETGMIKSAAGIGGLLAMGIGDTLRVSLTAPVIEEIKLGKNILKAVGLTDGPDIISCPTCGRCTTDVIGLTKKVEQALESVKTNITVAVMGCVVNGPGEAREADIGITGGGGGKVAIFVDGEISRTVLEADAMSELKKEIKRLEERKR